MIKFIWKTLTATSVADSNIGFFLKIYIILNNQAISTKIQVIHISLPHYCLVCIIWMFVSLNKIMN